MDPLGSVLGVCIDALGTACGVRDRRVPQSRSVTLAVVAMVLLGLSAYLIATEDGPPSMATVLAYACIPVFGTMLAGAAGGVRFPYPLLAGVAAGALAALTGFALVLMEAMLFL